MSSMDFETGHILVGHNASNWGPFAFDFEEGLPTGIELASVTVKSYLGRVGKDDDLSDETETTSELIGNSTLASPTIVQVFLSLPTTSTYLDANHTLLFEFTTDNAYGGTHSAFFYRVQVVKEA